MSYRTDKTVHPDDIVVDLSALAEPLMAYQDISDMIDEQQEQKLLDYMKSMLKMSYDRISLRYDAWLEADRAHDVWVPPDTTQFREKIVVADTRAIADTVLTYLMAALAGRNPMFQLEGSSRDSRKAAAILERLLHQHMRRTGGEARVAQLLLDSVRYGFSPTKITWNPQTNTNQIINFDPRRAFPDPRVSWGDWDKMDFMIFTEYSSTAHLIGTNLYPKIAKYPGLRRGRNVSSVDGWEAHKWVREESRGMNIDPTKPTASSATNFTLEPARIIDEAWFKLNGYQIGLPGLSQVWLTMSVLDEHAVVRLQLSPYGKQFPTVIGGLYFDRHKTYSQSLYDLLKPMHDISNWLLRSRVDNVQSALNNLIFVDPNAVAIPDLINRNPWGIVRVLPGSKPNEGVFISNIPDVTRGHWSDIAAMSDLKQRVSAASDAQQGVPTADGIRTATEIARLTQLGSQRLGVLARIMSATTIRPKVHMMVSNIQDALNYKGSIRLQQDEMNSNIAGLVKDGYVDFDVSMIQGGTEYMVVDGTLPIEPTRNAETWMTMLQVLNMTGLAMEYNTGRIVEEAIRAMGISDLDQFRISPQQRESGLSPSQQLMMMEKMRGINNPNVMPQDQVMGEAQKGNLIPMRQAAGMGR